MVKRTLQHLGEWLTRLITPLLLALASCVDDERDMKKSVPPSRWQRFKAYVHHNNFIPLPLQILWCVLFHRRAGVEKLKCGLSRCQRCGLLKPKDSTPRSNAHLWLALPILAGALCYIIFIGLYVATRSDFP